MDESGADTTKSIWNSIQFGNEPKYDPEVSQTVDSASTALKQQGLEENAFVTSYFKDPELFHALPAEIRTNLSLLMEYIKATSKFNDLVEKERSRRFRGDTMGLLAEEVNIPKSLHISGGTRRAEEGYRVNVDYLRTVGIDPTKVLFFRITQPSSQPKPEYYWTSDYWETVHGLTVEVHGEQREKSVILVADLETINQNGGLIQDINDDSGLAVRQIGLKPFGQNQALAFLNHS